MVSVFEVVGVLVLVALVLIVLGVFMVNVALWEYRRSRRDGG